MVTPRGSAAWVRSTGIEDYDSHTLKGDAVGNGPVQPQTDVEAAALMRIADDMAAVARTAAFATIRYRNNDAAPAAPTVHSVNMMTGVDASNYAGGSPPSGFPTLARNGDGDVTITFASSYTDETGASVALVLDYVDCTVESNANDLNATWELVNDYTVRIRCWNANAQTAALDKTLTVEVA